MFFWLHAFDFKSETTWPNYSLPKAAKCAAFGKQCLLVLFVITQLCFVLSQSLLVLNRTYNIQLLKRIAGFWITLGHNITNIPISL